MTVTSSKSYAKRCGLEEYHIPFAIFNFNVVLITGPMDGVSDFIKWKYEDDGGTGDWSMSPSSNTHGLCIYKQGSCPIVWLQRKPATAKEYGYLSHEMLHAVKYLSSYIGMKFCDETEEFFCYSLAHGVEDALRQMGMK